MSVVLVVVFSVVTEMFTIDEKQRALNLHTEIFILEK